MTADDFRRIALGFDGAVEGAHMNHPDFRANGRIFATLSEDLTRGMVKLSPDVQKQFLRASRAFQPASGAWGLQGATMVQLDALDEETLGDAMTVAWQGVMAVKPPARRSTAKKRSARKVAAKPAIKARASRRPQAKRRSVRR
jgi:hypothetical protein